MPERKANQTIAPKQPWIVLGLLAFRLQLYRHDGGMELGLGNKAVAVFVHGFVAVLGFEPRIGSRPFS